MNPDLAMGDDLLKKTGAGNLFMFFGEPDIEIKKQKDGKLVVKIKGLDVYDPTTGQIRSHSPTTSPAGSSTPTTTVRASSSATPTSGADDPYDKLKRALRAEIDEAAWAALLHQEPPLRPAQDRQNRHQGHQPLR